MTTLATVIGRGVVASRPAAASAGRLYFATDGVGTMYRDNGSSWDSVETTGTGFANPMTTAGDTIYGGASGVATRLPGDSSGKVLTSNGATSAPSWQTPSAGGGGALVFLEAHTASSSASLDFTTFISSTYDTYKIEGVEIVAATSTANLCLLVGTGGGPTYDTTVGNYEYAAASITTNAASVSSGTSTTTLMKLLISMGTTAGWNAGFSLTANALQSTSLRKIFFGTTWQVNSTPAAFISAWGGNWLTTGTAVTALQFKMSTGNIASGTIRIYGVTKS